MADDFKISSLNMLPSSPGLAITEGVACDPPYVYVTPHNDFIIAKIDTRTFTVVDTLDLSKVDPALTGMLGCFIAGGYLYILPHLSNTGPFFQDNAVKVDLGNFTPAGCETLALFNASQALSGSFGLTDGVNGYLNLTVFGQVGVTRFGLAKSFSAASISTVSIATIAGYPVMLGNLVALDDSNAYVVATVVTNPGNGQGGRTMDLWLASIPTANFTAKAATFQRLTNISYPGSSVPRAYAAVDDGKNLWCFPFPLRNGPMNGKSIGVIQIPKADPSAVAIHAPPPAQAAATTPSVSGTAFYDGWRYGYLASQTAPQIMQLDTHNPGVVNVIDISANSGGYPMYGLSYDGAMAYACSFNGGAGLCLKFLPTQPPGN